MKILLYAVAFILMATALQVYFPWWIMPVVAVALSFGFGLKPFAAFGITFLLAALLWGGYAGYVNNLNDGLMADKVGQLFGGLSGGVLIVVTAVFGGLFAGLGGLVGGLGRAFVK